MGQNIPNQQFHEHSGKLTKCIWQTEKRLFLKNTLINELQERTMQIYGIFFPRLLPFLPICNWVLSSGPSMNAWPWQAVKTGIFVAVTGRGFTRFVLSRWWFTSKQARSTISLTVYLTEFQWDEIVINSKIKLPNTQRTSLGAQMVESAHSAGDLVWEDPLGEGMAAHTSNLAWTKEPGGLKPTWSQRVWQDWQLSTAQPIMTATKGMCRRDQEDTLHPYVSTVLYGRGAGKRIQANTEESREIWKWPEIWTHPHPHTNSSAEGWSFTGLKFLSTNSSQRWMTSNLCKPRNSSLEIKLTKNLSREQ